ncbi:unnamed protein product, partial [Schistosoma curassoni]|uniref:Ovule protein n=1 Tax=Schistosoma curassoni TaxID=6186 RepID=A0A183JGX0_9TREM
HNTTTTTTTTTTTNNNNNNNNNNSRLVALKKECRVFNRKNKSFSSDFSLF